MYTLQFQKQDTLQSSITAGATSATLTSGNFGSPTGTQLYVIDYDNANAEVVSATVAGTAMTSMTRGLDNTTGVSHSAGAKVLCAFVPSHYSALLNGTAGFSFDKVRVTNAGNVSVATGNYVKMTFDTEDFDTNGLHVVPGVPERLTCVTSGYYLIVGCITWEANSTGVRQALIYLNNTDLIANNVIQHCGATTAVNSLSTIYYLEAGDYIDLRGYQNSGSTLNMLGGVGSATHFSMTQIA